ncbi:TAFII55 protein conserved region-domain-containing protein [Haematococcus lacustris]
MANRDGQEEHYVLRVTDPDLADRLRRILREEESLAGSVELRFPEDGRHGVLSVEGQSHSVRVLDLPTVVESYKTYDDVNLVKTGDVGQILVVGGSIPEGQTESTDGLTPPMRKARQRHLRPRTAATPAMVSTVEDALHQILNGCAPKGSQFIDVEEEWVVEPGSSKGRWQPVAKAAPGGAVAAAAAGATALGPGTQPASNAAQ